MVEIYNEKVQNLLINPYDRPNEGLMVREHKKKGVYVDGVIEVPVSCFKEINDVIQKGKLNRSVAAQELSHNSSRAHTIVTIELKQIDSSTNTEKVSVINLVDLAGSEKINKSRTTKDRFKEGYSINKSLTTLGRVITILSKKNKWRVPIEKPPYRESTLTWVLSNALGGNSKTLMLCTLSPASSNYEETMSILRYAE